ncbi:MAG: hypothetical protein CR972_00660 [Candidatus Moraniibacteriota bacterium]|nr:MAG: hypothetical protein CR972_00660 [Candidatus Moranbacteria bacterium]
MFKKILVFFFLFTVCLTFSTIVDAAGIVPCGDGSDKGNACTICHLVAGIYNIVDYIKNIIVIVAIAVITIAGIMYIVSAGNSSMTSMAKAAIKNTLIGISIFLLAFMLITTIINSFFKADTALIADGGFKIADTWTFTGDCSKKTSPSTSSPSTSGGTPTGGGVTANGIKIPPGTSSSVAQRINKTPPASQPRNMNVPCKDNCMLVDSVAKKIENAYKKGKGDWRVTEGWPATTSRHKNNCHYDATCVDINFKNPSTDTTTENINRVAKELQEAGLRPVYETNDQSKCEGVIVECKVYSHITAPHFSAYDN